MKNEKTKPAVEVKTVKSDCKICRFFVNAPQHFMVKGELTPKIGFPCHRFPQVVHVAADYWCGEFQGGVA